MPAPIQLSVHEGRIQPPDDLAPDLHDPWNAIANSLPAGYFRPSDRPLLQAYVQTAAFHRDCAQILAREGLFYETRSGTKRTHPAAGMMLELASTLAQLATKLRLCPSARLAKGAKPQRGVAGGARPWDRG